VVTWGENPKGRSRVKIGPKMEPPLPVDWAVQNQANAEIPRHQYRKHPRFVFGLLNEVEE